MSASAVPPPATGPDRPPLVVALTGGIASGKSEAGRLFQGLGITLVDTDAIAHGLTAPGGAAIPDLVAAFGPQVLDRHGALDRPAMRTQAFADPRARRRLEGVLHGRIREQAQRELAAAGSPYALLAIPLYTESGSNRPPVDQVLVVDCPLALQRSRALQRPGLTAQQVDGILAAQATRAERLALADQVIDNSGSLAELAAQVAEYDRLYRRLAAERAA